jgi:hypothetical protein
VLARVDEWAEANDCTRSEAVATLLELGLGGWLAKPIAVTPAERARASKPKKAAKAVPPKKTRQRRS